jgi:hypothetical protein
MTTAASLVGGGGSSKVLQATAELRARRMSRTEEDPDDDEDEHEHGEPSNEGLRRAEWWR